MVSLRKLILNKNNLSSESAKELAEILKIIPITHLELHYNSFSGVDLIPCFECLNTSALRFLDLSWNNIGNSSECVSLLADQLEVNKSLLQLDISHNGIREGERV